MTRPDLYGRVHCDECMAPLGNAWTRDSRIAHYPAGQTAAADREQGIRRPVLCGRCCPDCGPFVAIPRRSASSYREVPK